MSGCAEALLLFFSSPFPLRTAILAVANKHTALSLPHDSHQASTALPANPGCLRAASPVPSLLPGSRGGGNPNPTKQKPARKKKRILAPAKRRNIEIELRLRGWQRRGGQMWSGDGADRSCFTSSLFQFHFISPWMPARGGGGINKKALSSSKIVWHTLH